MMFDVRPRRVFGVWPSSVDRTRTVVCFSANVGFGLNHPPHSRYRTRALDYTELEIESGELLVVRKKDTMLTMWRFS